MSVVKHYFLSVQMPGGHLHCYVMTNDKKYVERAGNRLIDEAEKLAPVLSIVLQTGPLSAATTERLRNFICQSNPPARQVMEEATNFHMSIFGVPDCSPDSEWLVAIH